MLMKALTQKLHGMFINVLDSLDAYKDEEVFRTEIWQPTSKLHIILVRFGRLLTRSQAMAITLPAVTDLNTISTAIDGLAQDEAVPAV